MKKIAVFIIIVIVAVLGYLLYRHLNSGLNTTNSSKEKSNMTLRSNAFSNERNIPKIYTCDGQNINPFLRLINVPHQAQSLALIVEDKDSPSKNFTHWILFNIPAQTKILRRNRIPEGTVQGINDFGDVKYTGPCPNTGTHRYIFTLYALDKTLDLKNGATKNDIINKMENHILQKAELSGIYKRM